MNGDLRPSDVSSKSTAVVWWTCDADPPHVWQAAVRSRAGSGSGCPSCSRPQKKLLQDHHPELAREWHPTKNLPLRLEDTGIGTEKRIWWRCSTDPSHEWDTLIAVRIQRPSCPLCTGRIVTPETSLAGRFPEIAKEWHPTRNGDLRPDQMRAGSERHAWWRCSRDPTHEWRAIIGNRARGHTCPMCSGRVATPATSIQALYPEVARNWHPTRNGKLTPDQVKLHAKRRFWWRCPVDRRHEWQASPSAMARCPICVGKKVIFESSLAGAAPEIAREWHPTRNGDRRPGELYKHSLVRVWWQCAVDPLHEWENTIAARVKNGTGCPYCGGRAAGPNTSLRAVHPEIAREWHPTKNRPLTPDTVVPGAAARVWWRCHVNPRHRWQARVCDRTANGSGCPVCFMAKHRVWLAENNRTRAKKRRGE
jgi:hypothetical protein